MTRLFLARHGETDWNRLGKLQGHTDIPLNEAGRTQARALAARLAKENIARVITSDLSRARETGSIVAEGLALATPHVDEELRERCFGVFEGLTRDECSVQHPTAWRAWIEQTSPPEGAEAVELAVRRMTRAFTRVVEQKRAGNDERASLIVSHGGVMRLWLLDLLGVAVPLIGNGTVYLVEHDPRHARGFHAERWEPSPSS